MARREAYTRVDKIGFVRPDHVAGMSDRGFRVFQCLNPDCVSIIKADERHLVGDWHFDCPECNYSHHAGGRHYLFDYRLMDLRTGQPFVDEATGDAVEDQPEFVEHDDYLRNAARWKYCVLCSTMKPLSDFDLHGARAGTGRQGECSACKAGYNGVKNGSRLIEQHREASQQRRLMIMLGQPEKLDRADIVKRFEGRCFKCNEPVDTGDGNVVARKANWDHTRPAAYLWPMTTQDATLLCQEHNGDKADAWPGAYYTPEECRRLSRLTGIEYADLMGPARHNPEALNRLKQAEFVESLMDSFARYPELIIRLRNRLLRAEHFDFFDSSPRVSGAWREKADILL